MNKRKVWCNDEQVVIRDQEECDFMNQFYDKVIHLKKYKGFGFTPEESENEFPIKAYIRIDGEDNWGWDGERQLDGSEMSVHTFRNKYSDWLIATKGNEWTDSHYDNNYTLTEEDIEQGFIRLDAYTVAKVWKIGSKDDSGALFHLFKTFPRYGVKNTVEREIKAMYAQIKCLAKIEGVKLD